MSTEGLNPGGASFTVHDLKPGDGIRWAVGSPDGRRSSTWRLWGNKKGDVYLAARNLGGAFKISIHKDRRCSIGFTKEYEGEAKDRFGQENRHWQRWTLPSQPGVKAVQVIIPESELEKFHAQEAEPMAWVPAPGPKQAVIFTLFIAEPPEAASSVTPEKVSNLLGTISSKTRFAWIVHLTQALDQKTLDWIQEHRVKIHEVATSKVEGMSEKEVRMVLVGNGITPEDVFCIEMSATGMFNTEPPPAGLPALTENQ